MENNRHSFVKRIFSETGSTYELVVALTTLGLDSSWKKRIVHIAQGHKNPRNILDLACGTGILTRALARTFPESQITAVDLQEEYIRQAEKKNREYGIATVKFQVKSAESVCTGEYDIITASYLPKYVNLDVVIENCSKILRPEGIIIFHDFIYPEDPLLRALYDGYWMILGPLLWLSCTWREMSRELKSLIAETHWVDDLRKALVSNGFRDITEEVQKFQTAAIISARN
ncbi:MAG: class I SAM-dependent methyltransferase [Theionarchaea archaeon]|nr:class I SAM-dependent methyltransferase [Theionarchaea archaeon]